LLNLLGVFVIGKGSDKKTIMQTSGRWNGKEGMLSEESGGRRITAHAFLMMQI